MIRGRSFELRSCRYPLTISIAQISVTVLPGSDESNGIVHTSVYLPSTFWLPVLIASKPPDSNVPYNPFAGFQEALLFLDFV